jgi:hypothetical protein
MPTIVLGMQADGTSQFSMGPWGDIGDDFGTVNEGFGRVLESSEYSRQTWMGLEYLVRIPGSYPRYQQSKHLEYI